MLRGRSRWSSSPKLALVALTRITAMAHGTESALVTRIVKAITKKYPTAWTFKVVGNPYQMSGVPDILACVEGRLVGIEVKSPKPGESLERVQSRVTAQQRIQIDRIEKAGGVAGMAHSVDTALALVQRALGES